jgi:hypothetical protein
MGTDPKSPSEQVAASESSPESMNTDAREDLDQIVKHYHHLLNEAYEEKVARGFQGTPTRRWWLETQLRCSLEMMRDEGRYSLDELLQFFEIWRDHHLRSSQATDRPVSTQAAPESKASQAIDPALLEDVGAFVDDAEGWFHTANVEFEGRKPIDLLGTPDEARLRNRIEMAKHGMFS